MVTKSFLPAQRRGTARILRSAALAWLALASAAHPEQILNQTFSVNGDVNIKNNELTIASILQGDRIGLSQASGTVNFNTSTGVCHGAGCDYVVDAAGLPRMVYDDNQLFCYNCDSGCSDAMTGVAHAGLYMRVGSTFTFIGKQNFNTTAAAAGTLKLGVNDCVATPNSGSFSVPVTINRPAFSVNSVAVSEAAATATFTVTLDLAPPTGQTAAVSYTIASGTAILGTDFNVGSATGTLTFTAGQTTKSIVVNIVNDAAVELNETYTVTLSSPQNGKILTNGGTGTGTINDDDPPNITINNASVTEGNTGTVTATFTVSLSAASGRTVTVHYATANGTATAGSDYTAKADTVLTFSSGTTSQNVTVSVTGDTAVELNETFVVNLSSAVNGTITDAQGIGTINDDDPPNITISDTSVTEGNTGTVTATFTVSLSAASGRTVTVHYATANGTATAGSDYTAKADTVLTFSSGTTSQNVTVSVTGDTAVELNETFSVNLSSAVNGTITDAQGIGTINDDDPPNITIGDTSVTEGDSGTVTATFAVSLSAASGRTVTVDYATANGAATAGADYTTKTGTLTFNSGTTTLPVTVSVIGDALDEDDEAFTVDLSASSNGTITDAQGQGLILDNDPLPSVQFTASSSSSGEGTPQVQVGVSLSATSGRAVTAPYTLGGTATGSGTDFTVSPGSIGFLAGETTKNVTLTINDDALDEDDETVILTLAPPTNASLGNTSVHTATIEDDDLPPTVSFQTAASAASEASGLVNLTAVLSSASGLTVSVGVIASGTATGGGTDYTLSGSPLSFVPGDTSESVTLTIAQDLLDEPDETVTATLSSPVNATLGGTPEHVRTIQDDDDPPAVDFTVAAASGAEGLEAPSISVELSAPSGQSTSVSYAVTGGSAVGGGVDFTLASGILGFDPGQTTGSVPVSIADDSLDENDETVQITLSASVNASLGARVQFLYTIADDDEAPAVAFDVASSSGPESLASPSLGVSLSASSAKTVTVAYSVTGGTATGGGVDYTLAPGSLSFSPGQTMRPITLGVVDDAFNEPDETVQVTLAGPQNATLGSLTTHSYAILETAPTPVVDLTTSGQTVPEGVGDVTVTATMSSLSGQPVTVPFTVSGTASHPADHGLESGSITIPAGSLTGSVSAAVIDDGIQEPAESIVVTMGTPTNANAGPIKVHTVTIQDDDLVPSISVDDPTVMADPDAETSAVFTITLSSRADQLVTVDYTTADGTATAGQDYVAASGAVSFTAGATSRTVSVRVLPGGARQTDTFFLDLSNPSFGNLSDARGTATIQSTSGPVLGAFSGAALAGLAGLLAAAAIRRRLRRNPV